MLSIPAKSFCMNILPTCEQWHCDWLHIITQSWNVTKRLGTKWQETIILSNIRSVNRRGLDWIYWQLFSTWLMTTLHYSAVADLHTLQNTTAHAKSFQSAMSSPVVPWQRFLTVEMLQRTRPRHCQLGTASQVNWAQSRSQSQSYFTTGGLASFSSSWRQAPRDLRPVLFFSWTHAVIVLM
jgi:hypothetical protein